MHDHALASSCAFQVAEHVTELQSGTVHGLQARRYAVAQVQYEFDEPDFAMIDTLFSLAEAHLFMQLVELQDEQPDSLPAGKTRPDLYRCASCSFVPCGLPSVFPMLCFLPCGTVPSILSMLLLFTLWRFAFCPFHAAFCALWHFALLLCWLCVDIKAAN